MKLKETFLLLVVYSACVNIHAQIKNDSVNEPEGITDSISEQILNEITVRGERPMVKIEGGKLDYDLPRIIKGKIVSNAYEAILQLPGVREQDGNLILAGAGSPTIVLDGKPSSMNREEMKNLLISIPKERIERAEVMFSAPPQYHVRGALIDLILKKDNSSAPVWQGELYGNYSQRFYAGESGGFNLHYLFSRLSADFMYDLSHSKEKSVMDLYSRHQYNDSIYNIHQKNPEKALSYYHNIRASFDYNTGKSSLLSFAYTAQISKTKNDGSSLGNFSTSTNLNENTRPVQMHNLSLNYLLGKNTKMGADFTYYLNEKKQDFQNIDPEGSVTAFQTDSKQEINKISLHADQSIPVNKLLKINAGSKFDYTKDDNSQNYHSKDGENLSSLDFNNSIKEYTWNAYAGLSADISRKLSASASLTGEYYKIADYTKYSLFPAFEIDYTLDPSNILRFSLSSDKTYPDYWVLNESITYLNAYAEVDGNPYLKPSDDYTLNLNYLLKSKYSFSLYINNQRHYFAQTPYQSSKELKLIYKTVNYNFDNMYGFTLGFPFKIGKLLHSSFFADGFYNRAKCDDFYDSPFDKQIFAFYAKLDNTITLSSHPEISLQMSGQFFKPNLQGPMELSNMWGIDSGIQWNFEHDKAQLRLKGKDLFNTWVTDPSARYANQDFRMSFLHDSREITLSFTYKFGGYKEKKTGKVDTSRFGH